MQPAAFTKKTPTASRQVPALAPASDSKTVAVFNLKQVQTSRSRSGMETSYTMVVIDGAMTSVPSRQSRQIALRVPSFPIWCRHPLSISNNSSCSKPRHTSLNRSAKMSTSLVATSSKVVKTRHRRGPPLIFSNRINRSSNKIWTHSWKICCSTYSRLIKVKIRLLVRHLVK